MTAVTVADVPAVAPAPTGAPGADDDHDLSWLGDPFAPDNPAGFAQAVGRARRGERPTALLERARAEGLHLLYTPRAWGGALDDPVRAGHVARTLVARDGDVMTNLLMSLTPVLVTGLLGSGAQRASAVDAVTRGVDVGYALSEREHGSDLLRMDTTARTDGSRVVLDGRKWWVGRAPTAGRFVVVARSGGRGPTAFSAYDVPADAPGLSVDAPHGTAGFPGTAFADVGLSGVTIPSTALLGAEGSAMEAILRSQSVVRVLSLPASLAGMDADLMLLGRIAEERRGGRALRDDHVFLADAGRIAAWALAAEAVAEGALRELLTDPASAVLRSACAKHVVSRCVQQVHDLVGDALSTRGVDGDGPWGMHEQVARNARMIRVIDGSPMSTLRAVAGSLPRIAAEEDDDRSGEAHPPPGRAPDGLDPARLAVAPPRRDRAVAGLRLDADALRASPDGGFGSDVERLLDALDRSDARIRSRAASSRESRSAHLVAEMRRRSFLSSAASAICARHGGLVGPLAARLGVDHVPVLTSALLDGAGHGSDSGRVDDEVDRGRGLLDALRGDLRGRRDDD